MSWKTQENRLRFRRVRMQANSVSKQKTAMLQKAGLPSWRLVFLIRGLSVANACIGVFWLVSAWIWVTWRSSSGPWIGLGQGTVAVSWISPDRVLEISAGWTWGRTTLCLRWWPFWESYGLGQWTLEIPIWMMFLVAATGLIMTSMLWIRSARLSCKCKQCGYALDGLPQSSRVCPECGVDLPPKS